MVLNLCFFCHHSNRCHCASSRICGWFCARTALAESSYGVMELCLALAGIVLRADAENQCQGNDEINECIHENPAEFHFFLGRDLRNRRSDTTASVFRSYSASLGTGRLSLLSGRRTTATLADTKDEAIAATRLATHDFESPHHDI